MIKEASKRRLASAHIVYIDLRDLTGMNDAFSHRGGDLPLKAIGLTFMEEVGSRVAFGRLGGDEFGLAITGRTDAQVRRKYDAVKDAAFIIFQDLAKEEWTYLQSRDPKIGDPTRENIRAFAAKRFRLTPGFASVRLDNKTDSKEALTYLVERADDEMFRLKSMQKLTDTLKEIWDEIDLAEASGLNLEPSVAWMNANCHAHSRSEERFRGLLARHSALSQRVGDRILKTNEPWVRDLFGARRLLEEPGVIADMRTDAASIGAMRSERGVIIPNVVFPPSALRREPALRMMVDAIRAHDYSDRNERTALGFETKAVETEDLGWEVIRKPLLAETVGLGL